MGWASGSPQKHLVTLPLIARCYQIGSPKSISRVGIFLHTDHKFDEEALRFPKGRSDFQGHQAQGSETRRYPVFHTKLSCGREV
jgi:hypothetical protein